MNVVFHELYYVLYFSSQDDSQSETSSSVSQTSYDPNKAQLLGTGSIIPESVSQEEDGGVALVSAKAAPSAKG